MGSVANGNTTKYCIDAKDLTFQVRKMERERGEEDEYEGVERREGGTRKK